MYTERIWRNLNETWCNLYGTWLDPCKTISGKPEHLCADTACDVAAPAPRGTLHRRQQHVAAVPAPGATTSTAGHRQRRIQQQAL